MSKGKSGFDLGGMGQAVIFRDIAEASGDRVLNCLHIPLSYWKFNVGDYVFAIPPYGGRPRLGVIVKLTQSLLMEIQYEAGGDVGPSSTLEEPAYIVKLNEVGHALVREVDVQLSTSQELINARKDAHPSSY